MNIRVNDLYVGYGDRLILHDINLDIHEGEILSILGPNGSGKSTLLKAITGLIPYEKGEISIFGKPLEDWQVKELARQIAFLPQSHPVQAFFTVEEFVSYGRMPHQSRFRPLTKEDHAVVHQVMEDLDIMKFRDRRMTELSGGERQKVWLGCVLAQEPKILFLDEPTTYLDVSHQLEIMGLVRQLCDERGVGIVMVLHDLSQAMEISDRVVLLSQGHKVGEGKPEDVLTYDVLEDVYKVKAGLINHPAYERPILTFQIKDQMKRNDQLKRSRRNRQEKGAFCAR